MRTLYLMFLSITLAGCAGGIASGTAPSVKWVANSKTDSFTDVSSCAVTVGSLYTSNGVFTMTNKYYPYIEVVNGDLRVGVKSGGRFLIPVGDVQLRIDQNKAWTISTSETPLDYVPEGQLKAMQAYAPKDPQQQQIVENAYKTAMEATARSMSPFTASTGEKAQSILKEMRSGKTLIYRTVGLNQAASTTGEYVLDQSLEVALRQCGIQ
ncbi:hypothetical protein GIW50_16550 [Pseudomonas syringae]|uniref:Lipoprotein n=1 Tax=Pseudomonas syringae TaxID=317 RepID=A0A9Q3X4K3_PSESX|nr:MULTISPECIES: hypothetical protein [Pseudomonas]MCF5052434.1 hypothetical protein [Pseudomonas syringae]MBC3337507.1 hypothetical protein [Pseudomonas proteolytica]MCF5063044.1 hypothetical protein [Pseudomonas syringae]MCF5076561.1 hypothetical protein [Pseudomonas syringae]MCF5119997.1 hypothetical protein [Pseudomonas syringae]